MSEGMEKNNKYKFRLENIKERLKDAGKSLIDLINYKKNKGIIWAAGAGLIIFILILTFILPLENKNMSLHVSDSWKNIGMIDEYLYFREDKTLYCYSKGGKRWEMALDDDINICYGENVHLYKAGGKWQVLDKASGSLVYESDMEELLSIALVPKGAYSESNLLGIKKEGFVIFDKDFKVSREQNTRGLPMAYSANEEGEVWTNSGPLPEVSKDGQIEYNADPPDVLGLPEEGKRSLLVMEKDNKELVRLVASSGFIRPTWTGEDSFVVGQGGRLYFIKSGSIKDVPMPTGSDFAVNQEGVYLLSGRKLFLYNKDAELVNSWALDFDALALAIGKNTVCALSANRRFIKNKDKTETVDSGEWIGIITDIEGRKGLLYREELIRLD